MTKEEAIEVYYGLINPKIKEAFEFFAPELCENEDERIRKKCIELIKRVIPSGDSNSQESKEILDCIAYLERQKDVWRERAQNITANMLEDRIEGIQRELIEFLSNAIDASWVDIIQSADGYTERIRNIIEKQKKQKPIKMEVYEVGKGTTICGQDYKCKKDYKEGNCWYIKDVIYHCSRDGYLNDQNSVSWSCTPEWFKEYIYSNAEWAEKEKSEFVGGQFIQCNCTLDNGLKKGEHYWLEYVGDDTYVGRSDNILNQKFHITPRQLFTLFSQQLDEVQGPPEEEKQASLNYEPPFDENPSDRKIIEALIKLLKEQDGFLTAIDSVSTKAILSWLEQKLKSLRSKPKQDVLPSLSEKEIIFLKRTLDYLRKEHNRYGGKDFTNEIAVLEWLITHPILVSDTHWKPSEEQIMALRYYLNNVPYSLHKEHLSSLRDDCEKLFIQ